jgi:anti-sigma factor RsiW
VSVVEHIENLGAYALGALAPAEVRAAHKHLAHCAACRRQLEEFVEMKDVLDQVPLEALLNASTDGTDVVSIVIDDDTEPPPRPLELF